MKNLFGKRGEEFIQKTLPIIKESVELNQTLESFAFPTRFKRQKATHRKLVSFPDIQNLNGAKLNFSMAASQLNRFSLHRWTGAAGFLAGFFILDVFPRNCSLNSERPVAPAQKT